MADPLDSGLLAISLSDSDSEPDNATGTPAEASTSTSTRADRTALSEEAFQTLKSSYRAKVENGEIWSTVSLPLTTHASKPSAQELLHAVEELYFFRRYAEALRFLQRVFSDDEGGGEHHLYDEVKKLLRYYEERCTARLAQTQSQTPSQTGMHIEVVNTA